MPQPRNPISVVIPAKNESETIRQIILEALTVPDVDEVVVAIDPSTTDGTADIAANAGAVVVMSDKSGLGAVIKAGLKKAKNPIVFKTDGDIRDFRSDWITRSIQLWTSDSGMVKAFWPQIIHTRSVTALTVKPILQYWCPDLAYIHLPISGIYFFDKNKAKCEDLADDWGFDLDLLLRIHFAGYKIHQIQIPEIIDRRKSTAELIPMATEIVNLLYRNFGRRKESQQRILLVTAHPDDAEIWCGGLIAKTCLNGGYVRSIVVTGNYEREAEAKTAAGLVNGFEVICLGENQLGNIVTEQLAEKICLEIHDFKPNIIITHQPEDFHIDHRRVSELTLLSLLKLHHKNYPAKLFYCNTYFQKDRLSNSFSPDTYVDVSEVYNLKQSMIMCHATQRVEYYLNMAEAMDRLNGIKSGVKYAETFLTCTTHLTNKAQQFL